MVLKTEKMTINNSNKYVNGLVSIGIPTYNRPNELKRILKVATSQTYSNLEIIVSDNASPADANIRQIVDEFAKIDSRIKFYLQPQNLGILANAEFVLKQATGEYFTWFNDDDWRSPEFIELLVHELENNQGTNLAFCDYHEVYEDGSPALNYPPTHLGVFAPFKNKFRLLRALRYFWQPGKNGKANIFYAVFRKTALDQLDLKKISANYTRLNMDCLIVFSLLQLGPVSILPQAMCTLTCGNEKHYITPQNSTISSQSAEKLSSARMWGSIILKFFGRPYVLFHKLSNIWSTYKTDRDSYLDNTNSSFEKSIIFVLSYFTFIRHILQTLSSKILDSGLRRNDNTEQKNEPDCAIKSSKLVIPGRVLDPDKLHLPNVTLVAVATKEVEETLQALSYSSKDIQFGQIKLISDYTPYGLDQHPEIQFIRIKKMQSIDEWGQYVIYDLHKHIETAFALLVHADGFVVNPSMWRDEFLNYDYIGAPWPLPMDDFSYRDINGEIIRVGNSVSIRSKKLLELPSKLSSPWEPFHGNFHEDGFLCVKNRHIYKEHGIKYAPLDVAKYFSHEVMIPEIANINPFAFHKWAGTNKDYPKFSHMSIL